MTEKRFNLLDDPWIPCKLKNGEYKLLNVKDSLYMGNDILEIISPNPLIIASLHRLLLAILHRNFGPKNKAEWIAIKKNGKWDKTLLEEYFAKWHENFNLLGNGRRFYQVDISEEVSKDTPITKLNQALSSGNNTSLFDHSWDSEIKPIPVEEAAQLVIAYQNFSVQGGVSKPYYLSNAPLVSGIVVLLKGESLFETLLLNFIRYDEKHPFQQSSKHEDLPFWEREDTSLYEGKEGRFPNGYLDLLTWQSRRLWLNSIEIDGSILINKVKIAQGEKIHKDWNQEPQIVFSMNKDNEKKPIQLYPDRQVWRDVEALLRLNDSTSKTISPIAVNWISSIIQEKKVSFSKRYSMELYGLCNKKAKIIDWIHSCIPLPIIYLKDQTTIEDVKSFISTCEKIEKLLGKTLSSFTKDYLFPNSNNLSSAQRNKLDQFIDGYQLKIKYWNAMEEYFYLVINEVADESDFGKRQEIIEKYLTKKIIPHCRDLLNSVKNSLKEDPRAFKSIIRNFGFFFSQITEI